MNVFFFADVAPGIPPVVIVAHNVLKTPVYVYMLFFVAVGVTLSAICLVFNIAFRHRK